MKLVNWNTMAAERLTDSISRRMVSGEREMLVRWEFKKGAVAGRHSHPHEQVVMMVTGKLRLSVDDVEVIMGPNDIYVISSGIPHEAEALEDTVVIDIFSPPREDFLAGGTPGYLE